MQDASFELEAQRRRVLEAKASRDRHFETLRKARVKRARLRNAILGGVMGSGLGVLAGNILSNTSFGASTSCTRSSHKTCLCFSFELWPHKFTFFI